MRSSLLKAALFVLVAMFLSTGTALAAKDRIGAICAECHKDEANTIRGLIKSGSQKDDSFIVQVNKDEWNVRYDKGSKLNKLATIRDLPDEKAVKVRIRAEGDGPVYAEEMSYKSNYGFKDPADIITISEVVELLKKSPKDGNYVIFDSRGHDNFIEGHLPEAILLPNYQFQAFKDRLPSDKNTLIVSYCRGYG